jgi:hypothetical protein
MRIIIALAFFSQWSGNGLVSYYLNKVFDSIGITDPTIQLLINGILQIWNLAITVTASFAVERTGRRLLFLVSTIGMIAFFTVQTICSAEFAMHGSPAAAHAVIAMIFLYYASYEYVALSHSLLTRRRGANVPHSLAYSPLIVAYTIEILPFALRAKGFNIFNFVISVALIFNQYVNPIALGALGWKYYVRCFSLRAPVPVLICAADRVLLLAMLRARVRVGLPRRDEGPLARGDRRAVRRRGGRGGRARCGRAR